MVADTLNSDISTDSRDDRHSLENDANLYSSFQPVSGASQYGP
jgi:hypothetical protein